jgi:hypothetical protein
MCKWRVTFRWKNLDEGYNFAANLITIGGLYAKLWGPQNCESPSCGNFRSLETKCHLDVAPVERRREYCKGEGGGFPQVWAVVSLVNLRLPVARPSTKSAQTMH